MLMTLDDYKSFIAIDDMSELADNLLQLGRTLGDADNFAEYYRAANVTVSARFCLDDIQLGHFLQGFYNDSKEFRFDKEASSYECVAKLKEIGMNGTVPSVWSAFLRRLPRCISVNTCIVGKTISVKDLEEEGFKGIFVGSGAGLPNFMNIPAHQ